MSGRGRGDGGTGLISTVAGVTAFLVLLLFSVQLLTNLYATSVVTAAAYDGARRAATHGHPPTDDELAEAEQHARSLLGGLADRAAFEWVRSDDDIRLRVRVPKTRLLLLVPLPGSDEIDRTISIRIEEPR